VHQTDARVEHGHAGDLVQAMIDLGATICVPREPRCGSCPLRFGCRAFALGRPTDFPRAKIRKDRPTRFGAAWWIERDGALWLIRRPPRGVLGGMAALPGTDWSDARGLFAERIARVRHIFTHFALELDIVERSDPVGEGWWQPLDAIGSAGLPTLYRRAVEAVLDQASSSTLAAA
jgi:A/G-specific adenine glycosylase